MESLDHYEFEPRQRAKTRRKDKTPPKVHDRTEEAYEFIRLRLDLDYPFTVMSYANLTLSYFPRWAVERALAKMVKDGVLRGPVPVPKTKKGEALWYRTMTGARESGWLTWAEGQWRKWHTNLSRKWLIRKAKEARSRAAQAARPRKTWDPKGGWRERDGSAGPTTSRTASIREFMRAMPAVHWDGTAYYPVAGKAMDELMAWRASQPTEEIERSSPYQARPSGRRVKRTRCRRCGNIFYGSFGYMKRVHKPAQCNLLIVTRVMEE